MQITIYTKPNCPNCVSAKTLLKSKGLEYYEFDIEKDFGAQIWMQENPEKRQMPQIYIGEQYVGGLAGLQAALKQVGL